MTYLGIDFGTKRIGLAVGYPEHGPIVPFKTLIKKTNSDLFSEIISIIKEQSIEVVIVGIPKDLHGQESLTTRQANNFVNRLKSMINVPVQTTDETLTTFEAEERLIEAKVPASKRSAMLDQMAAVVILESFLNQKASQCHPKESS